MKQTNRKLNMLILLASFLFFTTVFSIPIDQVDVAYPSVETLKSGEKRITFRSLERDIDLRLQPAGELIADNFAINHKADGKKHHSVNVDNLRKKLFRDGESGAALHIDEDGPLTIKGLINSDLKIEPYESEEKIKDGIKLHRIIKISKEKTRKFQDAVLSENIREYSESSVRKMRDDQCVLIEYLFATESNFTHRFKNEEDIKVYISIMFTAVQNMMDTLKSRITVRLIGILPYTKGNDPDFITDSGISGHEDILHANKLTKNMSDYFCNQDDPLVKQAAIIMLITTRTLGIVNPDGSLFEGIVGVANIAGACNPCKKCGIVTDSDDYLYRSATIAHESAHLLGSPHDGEGPENSARGGPGSKECPGSEGYIMGDEKGERARIFSNCSIKNVQHFLSLPEAECIIVDC